MGIANSHFSFTAELQILLDFFEGLEVYLQTNYKFPSSAEFPHSNFVRLLPKGRKNSHRFLTQIGH